jgi:hypothetical protein
MSSPGTLNPKYCVSVSESPGSCARDSGCSRSQSGLATTNEEFFVYQKGVLVEAVIVCLSVVLRRAEPEPKPRSGARRFS